MTAAFVPVVSRGGYSCNLFVPACAEYATLSAAGDKRFIPKRHVPPGLQRATFVSEMGFNMQQKQSGVGGRTMAKIIEFYVPQDFTKRPKTSGKRGPVIEFVVQPKKSA